MVKAYFPKFSANLQNISTNLYGKKIKNKYEIIIFRAESRLNF